MCSVLPDPVLNIRFAPQLITGVSSDYLIEDFQEADLLVNITQHSLVPQHEVMSTEDKKELLKK